MSDKVVPLLSGPRATPDLEAITQAQEHPTFSCVCTGMSVGDDMMVDFRIVAPEDPKVMDWLTFLYLSKTRLSDLYEQVLLKALASYMEMPEVTDGIETARMDMEEYIRARAGTYVEDDGLGLRNVSDNAKKEKED